MRYLLSVEQKIYFKKRGFVELEEFFLPSELMQNELKKLATHPTLLHLAGDLFEQKIVRIAGVRILELPQTVAKSYAIQDISCIQGLVGCVMIGLEGAIHEEIDELAMPNRVGNVLFASPKTVLQKEKLMLRPRQKVLLIAYAEPTARFVFNDQDPEMRTIKALGYAYGDRLQEAHFPSHYAK